jgi:RNA polymerase sigma factor (sigma-70 family)
MDLPMGFRERLMREASILIGRRTRRLVALVNEAIERLSEPGSELVSEEEAFQISASYVRRRLCGSLSLSQRLGLTEYAKAMRTHWIVQARALALHDEWLAGKLIFGVRNWFEALADDRMRTGDSAIADSPEGFDYLIGPALRELNAAIRSPALIPAVNELSPEDWADIARPRYGISRELAEDVAQTAVLRTLVMVRTQIWLGDHTLANDKASLKRLILSIIHNLLRDEWDRVAKERNCSEDLLAKVSAPQNTSEDRRERLEPFLVALKPDKQSLLRLVLKGASATEIAEVYGISVGSAYTRKCRALQTLRAEAEKRGLGKVQLDERLKAASEEGG